jgi:hypothetical protein
MLDKLAGCPGYFGWLTWLYCMFVFWLSWMAMPIMLPGYGAYINWLVMLAILAGWLCCLYLLVGHEDYAGLLVH